MVEQEKISTAERSWTTPSNSLQKAIHYSFIKFCIYCFSLWDVFLVHCAVRFENISYTVLMPDIRISFTSAQRMSLQPIQKRVALFRGERQITRSHFP